MSHANLVAIVGVCLIVFGFVAVILAWGIFTLCCDLADRWMEQSKRIKNNRLDAAYRTKQFYVPYAQKDFK